MYLSSKQLTYKNCRLGLLELLIFEGSSKDAREECE